MFGAAPDVPTNGQPQGPTRAVLVVVLVRGRHPRRSLSDGGLEIFVIHVGNVDPRVPHLVHRAVAIPPPTDSGRGSRDWPRCCRTTT